MKVIYWSITFLTILNLIPFDSNSQEIKLIAHRGGVTDKEHAANSLAAIEEAIQQKYWMVEIDLRESADGRVIINHNPTFKKYYNDPRSVSELTWNKIKQLRSEVNGERPPLFKEVAAMTKGKIRLMLDIKGNNYSKKFYRQVYNVLRKNKHLSSAFLLNGKQAVSYFSKKRKHPYFTISFQELYDKTKDTTDISKRYYIFELPKDLNKKDIEKAKKLNIIIIGAINEFRYEGLERPWEKSKNDIHRLLKDGVKYFQIDSEYRIFFLNRIC